jgi:hypothetical protein
LDARKVIFCTIDYWIPPFMLESTEEIPSWYEYQIWCVVPLV